MDILLDTNVAIYAFARDKRLGDAALEILHDPFNAFYFSAVSVWEVVIKHGVDPSNMKIDGATFVSSCKQSGGFELPLTANQVTLSDTVLDAMGHRDPFDNMLMAQAKINGLEFMTCDKAIVNYGLPFVIDGRS